MSKLSDILPEVYQNDIYPEDAEQAILAWVETVIGMDDKQEKNDEDFDEWLVCATCDCILTDETDPEYSCVCITRNKLRAEQRKRAGL